jgi:glycosyltransferase involved in cell wall biosynthesis
LKDLYLLIAPHYPPYKTSASNQLFDLQSELSKNHNVLVISPTQHKPKKYKKNIHFIKTKFNFSQSNAIRFFGELLVPISFILYSKKNLTLNNCNLKVIYYSPPVFNSIFVLWLKIKYKAKVYLILRDIFPRWLYDLKILNKGFIYLFFYFFYILHLRLSNTIGIQSISNINFIPKFIRKNKKINIDVLFNWQRIIKPNPRFYNIISEKFLNTRVLVYAGNIGVAQNFTFIINLAKSISKLNGYKILIFGRGTNINNLRNQISIDKLGNIDLYNEIDRDELNYIINKSYMGIITLDQRHTTHNIPGKFLSYLQMNIPCIAYSPLSDLNYIIELNNLGKTFTNTNPNQLFNYFLELSNNPSMYKKYKFNISKFKKKFSSKNAVDQIIKALN